MINRFYSFTTKLKIYETESEAKENCESFLEEYELSAEQKNYVEWGMLLRLGGEKP